MKCYVLFILGTAKPLLEITRQLCARLILPDDVPLTSRILVSSFYLQTLFGCMTQTITITVSVL
jgi:hypothetical protein